MSTLGNEEHTLSPNCTKSGIQCGSPLSLLSLFSSIPLTLSAVYLWQQVKFHEPKSRMGWGKRRHSGELGRIFAVSWHCKGSPTEKGSPGDSTGCDSFCLILQKATILLSVLTSLGQCERDINAPVAVRRKTRPCFMNRGGGRLHIWKWQQAALSSLVKNSQWLLWDVLDFSSLDQPNEALREIPLPWLPNFPSPGDAGLVILGNSSLVSRAGQLVQPFPTPLLPCWRGQLLPEDRTQSKPACYLANNAQILLGR